jgi:hypothetical protein
MRNFLEHGHLRGSRTDNKTSKWNLTKNEIQNKPLFFHLHWLNFTPEQKISFSVFKKEG